MVKIKILKKLSQDDIIKKGLTFLIVNDLDKWKLSDEDKKKFTLCPIIERYVDRNIYYFLEKDNDKAKEIFDNIQLKELDNVKTFLCLMKDKKLV